MALRNPGNIKERNDDDEGVIDVAEELRKARENTMPSERDELERIARKESDVGTLARIILANIGDDVSTDDGVQAVELREGERQFGPDGNLYEWTNRGWVIVNDNPATGGVEYSDEAVRTPTTDVAPDDPRSNPDDATVKTGDGPARSDEVRESLSPTGTTPPFSGTPGAPNTTVDDTSQSGTAD